MNPLRCRTGSVTAQEHCPYIRFHDGERVLTVPCLLLSASGTIRSHQSHISRSAKPPQSKPIAVLHTRSPAAAWTAQSTGPCAALLDLEAPIVAQTKRPEAVVSCRRSCKATVPHNRPREVATAATSNLITSCGSDLLPEQLLSDGDASDAMHVHLF